MSVSLIQPETYQCARDECDQTRTEVTSVGSYCSTFCSHVAAGKELLKHIRQDHRFCSSCYRQLKEIERPPVEMRVNIGPVDHDAVADTWRNCLVGYEYITEHGELGQRSRTRAGAQDHVEEHPKAPAPADQRTMAGVICSCGTTDTRDEFVRDAEIVSIETAARRLCDLLELLGREGQHDKTVHAPTLLETVRAAEDPNWELAVGRAINADDGEVEQG